MRGLEVRDADGAGEPLRARLDQRLPGLHVAVAARRGPVDQVEVDVVGLEPVEAGAQSSPRLRAPVVAAPELGGDEDRAALEAGCADRLPDLGLVAVGLRGVDVAVAELERTRHVLDRLLRRDLEDAEAELRDL